MEKVRGCKNIFSFVISRNLRKLFNKKLCSTSSAQDNSHLNEGERLETIFRSQPVRKILQSMTGFNIEKIFKPRMYESGRMVKPRLQFMTDEEYQEALEHSNKKAHSLLNMPPYIHSKPDIPKVISKDPEIQGFLRTKLVCIDISFGYNFKNRPIVVRETNGVLRDASKKERVSTNQLYFPMSQREIDTPAIFTRERLQNLLEKGDCMFILEKACIQFEPDDPEFHQVAEMVYEHINSSEIFDLLRSTRFFGPMAFYLTRIKKIDILLQDMLKKFLVDDAANLIKLYYMIHQPDKNIQLQEDESMEEKLKCIKEYVFETSQKSHLLELVLQSVLDASQDNRAVVQ